MCDACIKYMTMASFLSCFDPVLPTWTVYQAPVSDLHPACGFFVNGCSLPHFIELNSGQVRRIPQIRYQALESHRETIKPWNMCLAVSQGGRAAWEVGTIARTHTKHAKNNFMHMHAHEYRHLHALYTDTAYCILFLLSLLYSDMDTNHVNRCNV